MRYRQMGLMILCVTAMFVSRSHAQIPQASNVAVGVWQVASSPRDLLVDWALPHSQFKQSISDATHPQGAGKMLLGPFDQKQVILPVNLPLPEQTCSVSLWMTDDVGVWGNGTRSRVTFYIRDGDRTIELVENTVDGQAAPDVQFSRQSYYAQVKRWTLRRAFLREPTDGLVLEKICIDRRYPERDAMQIGPLLVRQGSINPFDAKHVWKIKDFVVPKPISMYWTAVDFYEYGYDRTPQIRPAGWQTLVDADKLASLRVILTTAMRQPLWRVVVAADALNKPIDLPRLAVGCYLLELAGHDAAGVLVDRKRMVYEVLRDDATTSELPTLSAVQQSVYVDGLHYGQPTSTAGQLLKLTIPSNHKIDWQITGLGVSDGRTFAKGQLAAAGDHHIQWTPPRSGGFELNLTVFNAENHVIEREALLLGIDGSDRMTQGPITAQQQSPVQQDKPLRADLIYVHDDPEQIERLPETTLTPLLEGSKRAGHQVILSVPWYRLEPVPGCYNWQVIDDYIDKVFEKTGESIGLGLRFSGDNLPLWLWFEELTWQNQQTIHAGYHYVSPLGPKFRAAQERMYAAVFKRYQYDPRVGFYLYYAGPSEGFMTDTEPKIADYSPNAQQMFREDLQKHYADVTALNKAWHTQFADWQHVAPPLPDWSLEQENSRAWWDFHQFKQQFVVDRLARIQSLARQVEPAKPMIMYAKEGFGSTGLLAPVFKANQFRYTNGGGETLISYMQVCVMRNHGVPASCEGRRVMPNFGSVCSVITNSLLAGAYQGHHQNWGLVWSKRPHIGLDEYELARTLSRNMGVYAEELNHTQPAVRWAGYHGSVAKMMESRAFRGRVTNDFYDLNKVTRYQLHKPCSWVDDTSELSAMASFPLLVDVGANVLTEQAIDTLMQYMRQGGTFIASANTGQLVPGQSMPTFGLLHRLGVKSVSPASSSRAQIIKTTDGQSIRIRSVCNVQWPAESGAVELASNAAGKARLWSIPVGKGRLILAAGYIDFKASAQVLDQWLGQWAGGLMPFGISADRDCTAGVLRGEQADFVVLNAPLDDEEENATIAVMKNATPVQVTISGLDAQIKKVVDITTQMQLPVTGRQVTISIQPGQLHVLRLPSKK